MSASGHIDRADFDAVLMDLDGVVVDMAEIQAAAWKQLLDDWLPAQAADTKTPLRPFDADSDYATYFAGRPARDGLQRFLESRAIGLPEGTPQDGPEQVTVRALAHRQDTVCREMLAARAPRVYPGTLEFVRRLRAHGVRIGIFSRSPLIDAVLAESELDSQVDARIAGSPLPRSATAADHTSAMAEALAGQLEIAPARCVLIDEGAGAGESARPASFPFVIAVDRAGQAGASPGAAIGLCVHDLSECSIEADGSITGKRTGQLHTVWEHTEALADTLADHRLAVLLDYDGTLTPIVTDYRKAFLPEEMRSTLNRLAAGNTVAVISGRDMADVQRLVGLDTVYYSGSHGFELAGPGGWTHSHESAAAYLPDLDHAERVLGQALAEIPGHAIERKRFSIAVHYRQVEDALVDEVERAVDALMSDNDRLVKGLGKKVFELKPALSWDKGRAVELLLETLGMTQDDTLAVYIGDDITDEAVFRVLRHPDMSIVISDTDRMTSADHTLDDCDDVRRFLDWLSRTAGAARP